MLTGIRKAIIMNWILGFPFNWDIPELFDKYSETKKLPGDYFFRQSCVLFP